MPKRAPSTEKEAAPAVALALSAVVVASSEKRASGRKRTAVDYREDKQPLFRTDSDDEEDDGTGKKKARSGVVPGWPVVPKILTERQPLPTRDADGFLVFKDHAEFRPNLTPAEVLQRGSFGGTYYRAIYSSVTKTQYKDDQWQEFPAEWFKGLNIKKQVTSLAYRVDVNKYGVKCGGDLDMWESKGWIAPIDPYGWFQWYCRFYMGRRSEDDARQIARGLQVMGPTGRFRLQLMNKIGRARSMFDDTAISPVIRQTLQHWGYVLTEADFKRYSKGKKFF